MSSRQGDSFQYFGRKSTKKTPLTEISSKCNFFVMNDKRDRRKASPPKIAKRQREKTVNPPPCVTSQRVGGMGKKMADEKIPPSAHHSWSNELVKEIKDIGKFIKIDNGNLSIDLIEMSPALKKFCTNKAFLTFIFKQSLRMKMTSASEMGTSCTASTFKNNGNFAEQKCAQEGEHKYVEKLLEMMAALGQQDEVKVDKVTQDKNKIATKNSASQKKESAPDKKELAPQKKETSLSKNEPAHDKKDSRAEKKVSEPERKEPEPEKKGKNYSHQAEVMKRLSNEINKPERNMPEEREIPREESLKRKTTDSQPSVKSESKGQKEGRRSSVDSIQKAESKVPKKLSTTGTTSGIPVARPRISGGNEPRFSRPQSKLLILPTESSNKDNCNGSAESSPSNNNPLKEVCSESEPCENCALCILRVLRDDAKEFFENKSSPTCTSSSAGEFPLPPPYRETAAKIIELCSKSFEDPLIDVSLFAAMLILTILDYHDKLQAPTETDPQVAGSDQKARIIKRLRPDGAYEIYLEHVHITLPGNYNLEGDSLLNMFINTAEGQPTVSDAKKDSSKSDDMAGSADEFFDFFYSKLRNLTTPSNLGDSELCKQALQILSSSK